MINEGTCSNGASLPELYPSNDNAIGKDLIFSHERRILATLVGPECDTLVNGHGAEHLDTLANYNPDGMWKEERIF